MRARLGKIARLPHTLRSEVNRRLLDGQTSTQILDWLNAQPEAVKVWEAHFEGAPATAQNLSEWRSGGYREWTLRQEKTEALKTIAEFAHNLASSGRNVSEGAAAILGGQIVEVIETAALAPMEGDDDETADPVDRLETLSKAVARLRKTEIDRDKLKLAKDVQKTRRQQLALDREKFEMLFAKKFLEFAKSDEARAILESGKPQAVQMQLIRELAFGRVEGKEADDA